MTQTIVKNTASITPQAIALINSLGGPVISTFQTIETLSTTLENQACANTPVWALNVLNQTLRQNSFNPSTTTVMFNSPKTNPYITR